MATEKSFQLYINEDNVKQYFSTSGGVLNGAAIGGKYITMRTSSTTATFTMKDAGRDVLFPSAAAKAHKIEVWAQTIATLNSSKNTINVAIAGQNAITTERIHTSLTEHTGSVSGSFTKSNTSAVYVIKIANGFHAAGVRDTSITAYFTQYSCAANKVGNGVKSISVSNAEPYEGETVTFSAELYNGANFDGWYSDEACTQLVSSNLTHSTTAAADLALYAKATIDAAIYNCAAVAGENIASASVSDDSVVSGDSVTFTAQLNEGCLFDGWYSDSNYSTLVSASNPYTTPITSDTTLYAKASKKQFTITVGAAEHGIASVSSNIVSYGDSVTFTFTPEDETWELYGWYSDAEYTNLVSESNPYNFVVTADVILYPKVGIKRYKITLTTAGNTLNGSATTISIIATNTDLLTRADIHNLRVGNFSNISSEKIFSSDYRSGGYTSTYSISIMAPLGSTVALYAICTSPFNDIYTVYFTKNNSRISNGPHFVFTATEDAEYKASNSVTRCDCAAIALDGIEYAEAYPKTVQQGYTTLFSADVLSEYSFEGWYSDKTCTTLVSTDNPANVTISASETYLTLYAKATTDATTYNCSAVAGENITSASVSNNKVVAGGSVTFTALVNNYCTFEGWFSDSNYTTLVSTTNPYTAIITSDTTLYAKGTKISYSISVGNAEHGIATVSANTAHYGDSVTFTFTPEGDPWGLYGWYSDEGLTQLVSESNPYTHTVTDNVVLYPKVETITYKITFQAEYSQNFGATEVEVNIATIDFEALTRQEKEYLKTGDYNLISSDKVYDTATDKGNEQERTVSVSVDVPKGKYVAMYAPKGRGTSFGRPLDMIFYIEDLTGSEAKKITNWPYYWYRPTQDMVYDAIKSSFICNCIAIAKEGISYVDATTPVSSPSSPDAMPDGNIYTAVFSAETASGYEFSGWYSDEACTTLVSADNPAHILTPATDSGVESSYTLYAKATKIATGTGLYIKQNGTFVEATAVYKKVNGAWVQQTDMQSILSYLQNNNIRSV